MALDLNRPFDVLVAEFATLGEQLSVLSEQRVAICAEIERRKRDVVAKAKITSLSDDEKFALKAALDADPAVSANALATALEEAKKL